MSAVATAIVGSAVIGAYTSREASRRQGNAAERAAELQWDQYQQQRADSAPWREAGVDALGQLETLSGQFNKPLDPNTVMSDPGYRFALEQGNRNISNNAAAAGGLYSGAMLKALQKYGQGTATQYFNDAFNRQQTSQANQWGRLAQLAGIGQTANQQVGAAGMNAATNAGQFGIQGANASAANTINQGRIWGDALNSYARRGNAANQNTNGAWQWGGVNGTNDMGAASGGGAMDWWSTYGSGGD